MRPDDTASAGSGADRAPQQHATTGAVPPAGLLRRHRALASRAVAPLAVVAIVGAGAALAPSFASAAPTLPAISAQSLLAKALSSRVAAYSGTAQVTTNLGLPALPDLGGGVSAMSLLTGTHTLQIAADGPDKQRVALLGQMSEYDVVHDGTQLWVYDSSADTVGHASAAASGTDTRRATAGARQPQGLPTTPQEAAQRILDAVSSSTDVSVVGTQRVAGQAAYTLVLRPTQTGTLIGQVSIAIDAANGAALRVTVYPQQSSTPIFDLGFTSVSFGTPPDSRFDFTPPKGATVTQLGQHAIGGPDGATAGPGKGDAKASGGRSARNPAPNSAAADEPQTIGTGWLTVVEVAGVNLGGLEAQAQHSGGSGSQAPRSGSPSANSGSLLSGDSSDLLGSLLGSGRAVSGAFGTGKLFTTSALSVLITSDGRLFAGAVTPAVLEADAASAGR